MESELTSWFLPPSLLVSAMHAAHHRQQRNKYYREDPALVIIERKYHCQHLIFFLFFIKKKNYHIAENAASVCVIQHNTAGHGRSFFFFFLLRNKKKTVYSIQFCWWINRFRKATKLLHSAILMVLYTCLHCNHCILCRLHEKQRCLQRWWRPQHGNGAFIKLRCARVCVCSLAVKPILFVNHKRGMGRHECWPLREWQTNEIKAYKKKKKNKNV